MNDRLNDYLAPIGKITIASAALEEVTIRWGALLSEDKNTTPKLAAWGSRSCPINCAEALNSRAHHAAPQGAHPARSNTQGRPRAR